MHLACAAQQPARHALMANLLEASPNKKNLACLPPSNETAQEDADALGRPEAGLALQPKHANVSWTNFKALV